MTDQTTLTALRHRLAGVRDSMSDVHMTIPDSAIFANAKKRRTRRGIAAAMTAVCAAIGLAVALVLPGGQARAGAEHPLQDLDPPPERPYRYRDLSRLRIPRRTAQGARLRHR